MICLFNLCCFHLASMHLNFQKWKCRIKIHAFLRILMHIVKLSSCNYPQECLKILFLHNIEDLGLSFFEIFANNKDINRDNLSLLIIRPYFRLFDLVSLPQSSRITFSFRAEIFYSIRIERISFQELKDRGSSLSFATHSMVMACYLTSLNPVF